MHKYTSRFGFLPENYHGVKRNVVLLCPILWCENNCNEIEIEDIQQCKEKVMLVTERLWNKKDKDVFNDDHVPFLNVR